MRLMFTGAAPWANSGYSKPLRYLFPRLAAAGHEIALCAFYGWDGTTTETDVGGARVRIYPTARDGYFNDIIEYHAASWQAQTVITLQDVWILKDWGKKPFKWCPWLPIDTHPVSQPILQAIEGCHTPLVWVDWAKRELQQAGWMQTRVIPFGVDLALHQPTDRDAARAAVGLPDDGRFIAGVLESTGGYQVRAAEIEQCVDALADCNGEFLELKGKYHRGLFVPYQRSAVSRPRPEGKEESPRNAYSTRRGRVFIRPAELEAPRWGYIA